MPINVIDTIKPKNNGSFPIVEAVDVLMPDGKRLDEYEFTPGTEGSEEITVTVDLLPERTFDDFADTGEGLGVHFSEPSDFNLTTGEAYAVVWDGVEYPCEAASFEMDGMVITLIGNGALVDPSNFTDTGEPFAIYAVTVPADPSLSMTGYASVDTAATSHTVRVYQTTTTTIPTSSAVPAVSAMDNDKVMQVVDGKWTAVPLADSAVKTYIDEYINEALGGEY